MRRRTIAVITAVPCILAAVQMGVAIWSLPPPFLPDAVYRLKFGSQYPASRPAGDATLIDHGPRAAFDRYVVDLGPIADDLHVDMSFVVRAMPEELLFIGFDVTRGQTGPDIKFQRPDIGAMDIVVTTEAGEPVCAGRGSLSDWTWSGSLSEESHAFVYPVPNGHGDADAVSRVSFRPLAERSYKVHVFGDWQPDILEIYKVRLVFMGGGWKTQ